MIRNYALGLTASVSALALAAPALADTAAPPPSSGASAVGEVVVTANKREEALQTVAQSVTALPQQQLQQLQAFNFADYAKLVPGLTTVQSAPGDTQLILRGLNSGGDAATVATYIDEAPYGSSSSLDNGLVTTPDLDAFDMQRIEVLRGPQGTLYGASTLGGLLKFVTNPPDPTHFGGEIEAGADEVENSAGWSVKGMLNVPIGDTAAIRIDGGDVDYPGYISDPLRHVKNVNDGGEQDGRASFLWRPLSTLSIRLTAIAQNFQTNDSNEVDVQINPATGVPLQPLTPLYGDLQNARELSGFNHVQDRIYNGTVNWDLGWANITSQSLADSTLISGTDERAKLNVDKFTEEDRLASPSGHQLEWLVGGYYTRETGDLNQQLLFFGGPLDGQLLELANLTSIYQEEAGFATLTYHFTPQLDLAVGGRYAHNDQSSGEVESIPILSANIVANGASRDSTFTYSVAPRWRPNEDTTVYARIATGYQPGGPNDVALGTSIVVPRTFGPDTVTSYELGLKQQLLEHRLSFEIDAFHIDWNNIQLIADIANNGVDVNGGKAQSDGVEGQVAYSPIAGLTFSGNAAYTDARLTEDTNALLGGKSGDPLPYAPRWAGTMDAVYNWSFTDDVTAFVGATWSYVGDRKSLFSGTVGQIPVPSYNTFDLRLGAHLRSHWTVELFAKNVADVRGINSIGGNESVVGGGSPFTGIPGESVTIIQPRTVGVTVTARY
jgi:outer membrane receptor protein involved in Fe transport